MHQIISMISAHPLPLAVVTLSYFLVKVVSPEARKWTQMFWDREDADKK